MSLNSGDRLVKINATDSVSFAVDGFVKNMPPSGQLITSVSFNELYFYTLHFISEMLSINH